MTKILEYRDIPLDNLVIGKGQVRTHQVSADIEELAKSIEVQGLLQPILVCATDEENRWEILAGQRRFLAHKKLGKGVIPAAILDGHVDETEAKAISVTENLVRRQLAGKDLKDGILFLYKHYGTVKDVHTATGISEQKIRDNVKYPRLIPELKKMVNDNEIDITAALRAQDASKKSPEDEPDTSTAIQLAKEMNPMSDAQRKRVLEEKRKNPDITTDELIENAKSGSKVIQIVATVTKSTHEAVRRFAQEEKQNQDEATVTLIEDALTSRGFLGE